MCVWVCLMVLTVILIRFPLDTVEQVKGGIYHALKIVCSK
jgi:hypothetical protein